MNRRQKNINYANEVQVSIDGIQSHDLFRGKGSFEKSIRGINNLKMFDVRFQLLPWFTSLMQMNLIRCKNFFQAWRSFHGAFDVPCITGRLAEIRISHLR